MTIHCQSPSERMTNHSNKGARDMKTQLLPHFLPFIRSLLARSVTEQRRVLSRTTPTPPRPPRPARRPWRCRAA